MGTKTIGLREDAYKQLKARKREDESFTDLIERLLEETTTDWREGFGALSTAEMNELEQAITDTRDRMGQGLEDRQLRALNTFTNPEDG